MRLKIGILESEYLRDFTRRAIDGLDLDISFSHYTYTSLEDVIEIYRSLPDDVTGLITSGIFPAQAIRATWPESTRIVRAYNTDNAGIYKLFLNLFNTNRSLRLSRVYADFMEVAGLDLQEFLFGGLEMPYSEAINQVMASKTLDELKNIADACLQKHLRLWANREIDLSVTRFSALPPELLRYGYEVRFAYPGMNYLRKTLLETIQAVRINDMSGRQFAAVKISLPQHEIDDNAAGRMDILTRTLKRFSAINQLDFLIRRAETDLEIITNRMAVNQMTANLTVCRLHEYLGEKLHFDVAIGYGIGEEMARARINALDANREAARLPRAGSCLVNEKDELIGPLKTGAKLIVSREVSPNIRRASILSGLSYLTIQRIQAAAAGYQGRRLTARDLAGKLSITTRSANRFLSALAEADLASAVEIRRSATKGRPERIYHINLE
ncbi:hypothetical protein LJB99_04995 [Deltaproteobacteria bacterium OttesenSCG-928-K17]|nr:hypothetical protein [Deltaproteobacteria bacterium OttesenSCG-928-K17]